jgi:short-subunit dehydrogenase
MNSQHILITGCSTGIGHKTAEVLHQRGHRIIATVRQKEDAESLQSMGIKTLILDLDDSQSIHTAFDEALRFFDNRIDVLFNNAAYGQPGAIEDLTRTALREQFETNVFGTQELTNLALAQMRKTNRGRIIYNSSVLGLVSMAYRGAYNATKFAIESIADTLRLELKDTNITISLIEPGPITSQFRANAYAKYQQHIDKQSSAHQDTYEAMEQRLTKPGPAAPFTLPAQAVVDKVIHAVEAKRPKVRYFVTFPTYLLATLKWLLPYRWMDKVLLRIANDENKA